MDFLAGPIVWGPLPTDRGGDFPKHTRCDHHRKHVLKARISPSLSGVGQGICFIDKQVGDLHDLQLEMARLQWG